MQGRVVRMKGEPDRRPVCKLVGWTNPAEPAGDSEPPGLCCYNGQHWEQWVTLSQSGIYCELWRKPAADPDLGCKLVIWQLHPALR